MESVQTDKVGASTAPQVKGIAAEIGMKVRLNSGGPTMTIIDLPAPAVFGFDWPTGTARCAWLGDSCVECRDFPFAMLSAVAQ